ncbi:hypothetical protein EVAR_47724_1 [Eumeta japonica]|uniref:Uncharacterized protein n=1 Tax=Eumeta variegata TaxID=151549 RepID=A0A4C1VUL4_EUMVA|nr:hypothetical protein EVAR_47724_1 [Eumeta japonica]
MDVCHTLTAGRCDIKKSVSTPLKFVLSPIRLRPYGAHLGGGGAECARPSGSVTHTCKRIVVIVVIGLALFYEVATAPVE